VIKSRSGFDGIKAGALALCFDAFSSREPVPTSREDVLDMIAFGAAHRKSCWIANKYTWDKQSRLRAANHNKA